jgi:REP element-mobilizing transposase RayT
VAANSRRREPCIHVIIRGIERKEIVKDDYDRQNFVYRKGTIALETGTLIYAWTLMTNHAHIFLRRSSSGISRYMRRLLSGQDYITGLT